MCGCREDLQGGESEGEFATNGLPLYAPESLDGEDSPMLCGLAVSRS